MSGRPRPLLSLVLVLGMCAPLFVAQARNVQIERFPRNRDLANPSVSSIVQDHHGFLWFGTQGGLIRYDGKSFRLFEHDPYDRYSLGHNLVQTMYLDPEGVLWVGTYNGLSRFDPNTDSFRNYSHSTEDPSSLSNDVVVSIVADTDGSIWVGTLGGLNHLDPDTGVFTRYYADDDDPGSISNNVIRALFVDSSGRLWVGGYGGLDRYDRSTDSFIHVAPTGDADETLPSPLVMSITEAEPGKLWVGTWDGGLSLFDIASGHSENHSLSDNRVYAVNAQDDEIVWVATWGGGLIEYRKDDSTTVTHRYRDNRRDSLTHDVVYSLCYDSGGILWIGTNGGGLCKIDERKDDFIVFRHDPEDPNSLSSGKVNAILEDRHGDIWFGIYNGGLDRWDSETETMVHYDPDEDDPTALPEWTVVSLYEDRQGRLWVAGLGGLSRYDRATDSFITMRHREGDPDSLADNLVYEVLQDRNGDFWIGTYNQGVDRYHPDTKSFDHYPYDPEDPHSISDNLVYDIVEDIEGRIWVATNMGLNRYDAEHDRFDRFFHDTDDIASLSSNTIRTLFEDSEGRLWIGTTGGGLNRHVGPGNRFAHFTKEDGLPSNTVMAVLEDDRGRLWLATTSGICIFDPGSETVVTNLDESDGLVDTHFQAGRCKTRDGALHFGTISGVCRFGELDAANNTHVPNVLITGMRIFNEPADFGRPIYEKRSVEIPYEDRFISFEFAALDYAAPDQNRYAYRLEGFDKEWIQAGNRNFASYTNLPPGNYTFRVRGSNNDGLWNTAGASLAIEVTPPLWRTWWAYGLYALLCVGLVYLLIRVRSSILLKQKVQELEATKAQLERTNEQLVQTNQDLDDFAYIASHDLREPLRGISNYASFLLEDHQEQLGDEGKRKIDTLMRLSTRMNGLIGSLLDYSRIGRQNPSMSQVDTAAVTREVTDSLSMLIAEREAEIEIAPDLPLIVADRTLVYTILCNLISNGIKYNASVPARVSINSPGSDDPDYAVFQVSDNGIGISPEHEEYVFKIFKRLHDREAYGGGTGAGLTIVKKAVERHGGTVRFHSRPGEGTTFTFTLRVGPP